MSKLPNQKRNALYYNVFILNTHSYSKKFTNVEESQVTKPMIIAAMQDMGNIGSIVIDFINRSLNTRCFRYASPPFPNYMIDKGIY
ncbi:MAG TPA: hypothetical protein VIW25_12775 [Nitrososphaeraceae archaeon]